MLEKLYLLAMAGCILLCPAKIVYALEVTVMDDKVSVRMDTEKSLQKNVTEDAISINRENISLGNVTSGEQGAGIHRRTDLENVTIIQHGNKKIYMRQKTE